MPDFILSRPHGSLAAHGPAVHFSDPAAATHHLSAHKDSIVVGALPFSPNNPVALWQPNRVQRHPSPLRPAAPPPAPGGHVTARNPTPAEHTGRVRSVVAQIRGGAAQKVVLARTLALSPPPESRFDPRAIFDRLATRDLAGNAYLAAVPGGTLVGSSPEVLIRQQGRTISCHPLAGSLPRLYDPIDDQAQADRLSRSEKDLAEHAFVVDHIRRILEPLCAELRIPASPALTTTPQMWHLGTPITGTLRSPAPSSLEVALALHPTPAICGTPTAAAREIVQRLEPERGYYAGAVGWCDHHGNGEWVVTIRCALIGPDGQGARAYAGGGIVADSDPETELAETSAKFRTILGAFGIAETAGADRPAGADGPAAYPAGTTEGGGESAGGDARTAVALAAEVAHLMGVADLDPEVDLFVQGLDSLTLVRLVDHWRSLGHDTSFAELMENPTIAAWQTLLQRVSA